MDRKEIIHKIPLCAPEALLPDLPGRDISVRRISTGRVRVRRCDMYGTKEKSREMSPVYFYHIRHGAKGDFLIDAGLDSSFRKRAIGSQKGLLAPLAGVRSFLDGDRTAAEYLAEENIDLRGIFLSHLHFDHAAGLLDLPASVPSFVNKDEPCDPLKPFYYGRYLAGRDDVVRLDISGSSLEENQFAMGDFFGDQSLLLIPTPGHTPGHLSFLINGREEKWLVAGDALVYDREECLREGPGLYSGDRDRARRSQVMLNDLTEQYGLTLFSGHGA